MARKERFPVRTKMWRDQMQKMVNETLDAMVANGYVAEARYADDEPLAKKLIASEIKFNGMLRNGGVSARELASHITIWRNAGGGSVDRVQVQA